MSARRRACWFIANVAIMICATACGSDLSSATGAGAIETTPSTGGLAESSIGTAVSGGSQTAVIALAPQSTEALTSAPDQPGRGGASEQLPAASPYRTGIGNSAAFVTPSGNIACIMDPDVTEWYPATFSTTCQLKEHSWNADPRPDTSICPEGQSWAEAFVALMKEGVSGGICTGDSPVSGARQILQYGQSITTGSITCSSSEAGVNCQDTALGNGFAVSRESFQRLGAAPSWVGVASAIPPDGPSTPNGLGQLPCPDITTALSTELHTVVVPNHSDALISDARPGDTSCDWDLPAIVSANHSAEKIIALIRPNADWDQESRGYLGKTPTPIPELGPQALLFTGSPGSPVIVAERRGVLVRILFNEKDTSTAEIIAMTGLILDGVSGS